MSCRTRLVAQGRGGKIGCRKKRPVHRQCTMTFNFSFYASKSTQSAPQHTECGHNRRFPARTHTVCKSMHRAQYVQLPGIPQSKARFAACLSAQNHAVRMHRLSLVSLRFVPASVFPALRQPCYSHAESRLGPRSL